MRTPPVVLHADSSPAQSLREVARSDSIAIGVVDADGRLVGMLWEWDVFTALMDSTEGTTTRAHVRPPLQVGEGDSVDLCLSLLRDRSMCLPVVSSAGIVIGSVSRADLLQLLIPSDRDLEATIEQRLRHLGLKEVSIDVSDGHARLSAASTLPRQRLSGRTALAVHGVRSVEIRPTDEGPET